MTNIFILGLSRTGKSSITKKIVEEFPYYKVIPLDIIINAYKKKFNDGQIGYSKENIKENKLALFIENIINQYFDENDPPFIIEGDSILPEEYHKYFEQGDNICYFLINSKTPTEKVADCRQYDSNKECSSHLNDQELLTHFEEDDKIQQIIREQTQKFNYPIIDVSKNREKQLEDTYQKIKSIIKNPQNLWIFLIGTNW